MTHIDQIEEIRKKNNTLWMDILRVAMDYAPDETRAILKQINENDKKISETLGRL